VELHAVQRNRDPAGRPYRNLATIASVAGSTTETWLVKNVCPAEKRKFTT
jgi:hypothetical protein